VASATRTSSRCPGKKPQCESSSAGDEAVAATPLCVAQAPRNQRCAGIGASASDVVEAGGVGGVVAREAWDGVASNGAHGVTTPCVHVCVCRMLVSMCVSFVSMFVCETSNREQIESKSKRARARGRKREREFLSV
jgi:hypothetical protein